MPRGQSSFSVKLGHKMLKVWRKDIGMFLCIHRRVYLSRRRRRGHRHLQIASENNT
jgi:hypothetical protein